MTQPESDWERRRRLAEVFGDVLPDTTSDERDDAEPEKQTGAESSSDRWLREQVPPHHGS
jgi:hypothetical protein